MKFGFYPKLAFRNIRQNSKFYIPYLLTIAGSSGAFYILCALTFGSFPENTAYQYLRSFMVIGLFVVGLFSIIFLLYTNSFLIKRRSKELGLYNILGMDKHNISRMLACESIYSAIFGIFSGIIIGIILQKLITLLLLNICKMTTTFKFQICGSGIALTCILFCSILLLTFLLNLRRVHFKNPIELLHGSNVGEKEPKAKWLIAIVGVLTLGGGYAIAVLTKNGLQAIQYYFVAVFLVIIGTYCLFSAGSIALLKLLRKNKKFYYKTSHFIGVSGMMHRMNRNSIGLSNICILCTMVIVMISGTLSLYVGTNKIIFDQYPYPIEVSTSYSANDNFNKEKAEHTLLSNISEIGINITNTQEYNYLQFAAGKDNGIYHTSPEKIKGISPIILCFMTNDNFKQLTGNDTVLQDDEAAVYSADESIKDNILINFENIQSGELINTMSFKIIKNYDQFEGLSDLNAYLNHIVYVIVKDDNAINKVYNLQADAFQNTKSLMHWKLRVNTDSSDILQQKCYDKLSDPASIGYTDNNVGKIYNYNISSRINDLHEDYALFGGFFFLGIFLGLIFLMATVMIMYYKQVSEGYEDRMNFQIMQNVGLPKKEVKKSIDKQILIVFFTPLLAAVIHIAFDFRLVSLLLTLFGLKDMLLTLICTCATVLLFVIVYVLVYFLTSKTYYKIVS